MMCFFVNDTATAEIYTLSLHDALPILDEDRIDVYGTDAKLSIDRYRSLRVEVVPAAAGGAIGFAVTRFVGELAALPRSEEHTSELQSRLHLVCRLLLEKKNKICAPPRH